MKIAKAFAITAIIAVIIIYFIPGNNMPSDENAYNAAKSIIKATLLDPSSAEFIQEKTQIGKSGDSVWVFSGVLKATNRLGLKAPMEYYIDIRYTGGDKEAPGSYSVRSFKAE